MIKFFFIVIAVWAMTQESSGAMVNRPRRSAETCGVPKNKRGLIVRGQSFQRGSFPWIVALMYTETRPPKFFCGGTLISRTYVISAAHCILEKYSTEKLLPRDVLALFGAHDLSDSFEAGRIALSPTDIFIHDKWNPRTTEYDADVSLLQFEEGDIPFNKFVQPICLWYSRIEPPVNEGIVTGWGKSEDPTKIHENKPKLITAQLQPNEQCFLETKPLLDLSSLRTFCAGLRNGSGVCSGDSGGGLSIKVDGVYYLKGIVSSSLIKDDGCDVSKFAVYTNVLKFRDWIEGITGDALESGRFIPATQALKNVFCSFKLWNISFGNLSTCNQLSQTVDSEDFVLGSPFNTTVENFDIRDNRDVKYLPRQIGEKFPNLILFVGSKLGLTVVRDYYLKNMKNVQHVYLNENEIRTIESGAFRDLVSVTNLFLHGNMLETLDDKLFATMINLSWLLLKDNKIKVLSPTTFRIPGGTLKSVALWSNVCIDKWYGPNNLDMAPMKLRDLDQLEPDLRTFCAR